MPSDPEHPPRQPPRALVIAHEPDGPGGQVTVRLEQRGFDVDTHVVTLDVDQPDVAEPFPEFADYDVVAIMGSIRSLTRPEEIDSWLGEELDLIRAAHERGQPVLGVCFGGQLMAEALGGSVEASPEVEIGWRMLDPVHGVDNPVGPGPWMEWHHDRFAPPPGATLLATTSVGPQLFTLGRMVGTQFHPEIDHAHVAEWLAGAGDDYLDEVGVDPDRLLAEVAHHEARNNEQCHALVDWFLDDVAGVEWAAA